MKKVLFVVRGLGVGGIQRVTLELVKNMTNSEYSADILSFSDNVFYETSGLSIIKYNYPLKSPVGVLIRMINKLFPLLGCVLFSSIIKERFETEVKKLEKQNNQPYEKIYYCGFGVSSLVYKAFTEKAVFVFHNTKSQMLQSKAKKTYGFTKYLYKKVLASMKRSIAVSYGIKQDLVNEFNIESNKIRVIYNPIDYSRINELSNESIKSDFISDDYFVFVGRLVKEKRLDVLIDGFSSSKFKGNLLIFGEGPERVKYESYIKEKNYNRIHFMGKTNNPYVWMRNSKALLLTSDFEGLPTVLIEALMSGTNVISTDCPSGPKEILKGKLSKNLIPCNDSKSLAKKIDCLKNEKVEIDFNVYDVKNIISQYLK